MIKIIFFIPLFLSFFVPLDSFAKVFINEVAWMGNDKSQYGEWIELYNDAPVRVDLKDVTLYEDGGKTLVIKLTKFIEPNGYYLIARSTPSMPDPVGGLADDLGSFGGGGLSNSGEYLILKSASGEVLDEVDAHLGWPAGDPERKLTMQRSSNGSGALTVTGWVTATGTPRAANSSVTVTVVDSPAKILNNEIFVSLSSHSSQTDISDKREDKKIFANAGRDRLTLTGTPIIFEQKLFDNKSEEVDGGNASWSFGDGQSAEGKTVSHAYKFPGEYVVIMNVLRSTQNYVARTNVRVVAPDLEITSLRSDFVKIKNSSVYEANLGGWQLASGQPSFTFPKDTIILPKKEVAFSREVTGLDGGILELRLISPTRDIISTFLPKKEPKIESEILLKTDLATSSRAVSKEFLLNSEQRLLEARGDLAKLLVLGSSTSKSAKTKVTTSQAQQEIVQVIEKPGSLLKILLDLPVMSFRYIRALF